MTTPEYNLDLLHPVNMVANAPCSTAVWPRSLSGKPKVTDLSAGGLLHVQYNGIIVDTPERHKYWNYLARYLNGGIRSMTVPIFNDWLKDGSSVTDPIATLSGGAILNAGTISFDWSSTLGFTLEGGEWFAINHVTKGWRIYGIWIVDSYLSGTYTVGIQPPLREAIGISEPVALEFYRPRCLMRLPPDESLSWNVTKKEVSTQSISFVESFSLD